VDCFSIKGGYFKSLTTFEDLLEMLLQVAWSKILKFWQKGSLGPMNCQNDPTYE
jgi:hypothetical protein